MAAFAAVDRAGPARADVHLHGLPQPGLPGQGRRHRRRHLRRPGRDGHRRRLVRARVAGLRLRLPARRRAARACSTRACRSCARPGPTGTRHAGRQALPGRRRDRAGRCRCRTGGIPLWIAGGGEKKTLRIAAKYAQYTNFDATPDDFPHKSDDPGAALPRRRHRLRRDHPLGQLQRRHRRDRARTSQDKLAGCVRTTSRSCPRTRSSATRDTRRSGPLVGTPEQIVERLQRARTARHDLRDLLLPRRRVRPQRRIELFAEQVVPALS